MHFQFDKQNLHIERSAITNIPNRKPACLETAVAACTYQSLVFLLLLIPSTLAPAGRFFGDLLRRVGAGWELEDAPQPVLSNPLKEGLKDKCISE